MNYGLVVLRGHLNGQERAASQLLLDREDRRPVRVSNIPLGPLRIVIRRRFDQSVTLINCSVFGFAALRTPASVRDPTFDRPIERGSISARLSAGDDLAQHHKPLSNSTTRV